MEVLLMKNNMKKMLAAGLLITTMTGSVLTAQAAKTEDNIIDTGVGVTATILEVDKNFSSIEGELKDDLSKKELAEAKKLFEQIIKLEEKDDFEKVDQLWEKMVNTYFKVFVYDFNIFKAECIKKDATPKELEEAKGLFDKAMALEKKEDMEGAMKAWEVIEAKSYYSPQYYVNASYSFDDLKKDILSEKITKAQLEEAEKLFKAATALEEQGKYEEANKKWNALYEKSYIKEGTFITVSGDNLFDGTELDMDAISAEYTFDDFKTQLKKDVTSAQVKEAKKLFEEMQALEKEGKYEEADKKWNDLMSKSYIDVVSDDFTFDQFKSDYIKEDATKKQIAEATKLFDQYKALEKEGKYEEADKVFNKLLSLPIIKDEGFYTTDVLESK